MKARDLVARHVGEGREGPLHDLVEVEGPAHGLGDSAEHFQMPDQGRGLRVAHVDPRVASPVPQG